MPDWPWTRPPAAAWRKPMTSFLKPSIAVVCTAMMGLVAAAPPKSEFLKRPLNDKEELEQRRERYRAVREGRQARATGPQELVARIYPVGDLAVWRSRRNASPTFDPSILIAHLKTVALAESWNGKASIQPHATNQTLVVNQTVEMHERIGAMIVSLRKEGGGGNAEIPPQFLPAAGKAVN
jgi:hypothetical protein